MTKPDSAQPIEGSIILTYGAMGIGQNAVRPLIGIDFRSAVMTDKQKEFILHNAPVRLVPGYEQAWGTDKLKIIVEEVPVEFEADFWKPYGHKVNKALCLKEWEKLKEIDQSEAAYGVNAYLRFLARNQWRNKADPITYLKRKMWKTDWDNA